MRKRRVYLLILLGVVVAGVLVAVFASREREPEYGGKKLSEWVQMCGIDYESPQAKKAILQIGSNAVPYLVKWIRYEPPSWKEKLYAVVNKASSSLKFSYRLTDSEEFLAYGSMRALLVLGPEAHGAVRDLTKVMYDPKTTISANRALTVLSVVVMKTSDRRVVPALQEMLNDPNPKVRAFATHGLRNIEGQAPE